MITIRTPAICQNGHKNNLITQVEFGDIRYEFWEFPVCKCPKHEIGEGYRMDGQDTAVVDSSELVKLAKVRLCRY